MTTHSPPEAVSLAANGTQLSGAVLAAAVLTMGLMAGVFGLYAHTIMPGLRHTDDRTFVGVFQSTDRAIINPWFMAAFFGALVLTGLAAVLHLSADKRDLLPWIGAARPAQIVGWVEHESGDLGSRPADQHLGRTSTPMAPLRACPAARHDPAA
jgi:hypothetical protein